VGGDGSVSVFSNEQIYTNLQPAELPLVGTIPATAILSNSATLNGLVTPGGLDTVVYFAFDTSTNYGSASATMDVGSGTNQEPVSIGVTGLLPGTTYHFQAMASNSLGASAGGDMTFTTLAAAPLVVTQPATAVSSNSASLNASVTPEGAATSVYFAFGTNTSYGRTNVLNNVGCGTCGVPVSSSATGLSPGTTYHFQALASNFLGALPSGDLFFTTAAAAIPPVTVLTTNILGIPPSLSLAVGDGQTNLTIGATVGATLNIMSTTNDLSMDSWSAVTNVAVSNSTASAGTNADSSDVPQSLLDIAYVPGTVTVAVGASNAAAFQYFLAVMPYDYIILADQVLPGKGYTPRLMVINMPGIVADDACYVNQTGNFIHYLSTNSALQLISSGSTIRQIASTLAESLELDWTSASEFTYSNGLCQILATVIETEPPSSDPVAGQNPPGPPIVIDF
jgi:hypothetical protein